MPTAPATQPIPTVVGEEDEEIAVLVEELDRYFFSPLAGSASSPIFKHLETKHKHFDGTFPTNPMTSAQLQKSHLRVANSADSLVAFEVKKPWQHLVVKLEMLAFNHKVYEEYRSSDLKSLNRLLELRAQKESLKG